MGYNFQLPQSPHVVTIKKKLSIPVPVQLENNPSEGAFQYLSKCRKHYLPSLDGILLSWNTQKIRLKNKAIPPYFQARVFIKGEFTILRIKNGDKLSATVIDQKPSAIVARALENFLVFIEVPNLDVLFHTGDEVSFTFDSYEWEDMNPVIYGINPTSVNSSASNIRRPVLEENNSQKVSQQPTNIQQKRKLIAEPSTQIENERKKKRVEGSSPPSLASQPRNLSPQSRNLPSQSRNPTPQSCNLSPQIPNLATQPPNLSPKTPILAPQPSISSQPQRRPDNITPILGLRIPAQQRSSESSKTPKKSSNVASKQQPRQSDVLTTNELNKKTNDQANTATISVEKDNNAQQAAAELETAESIDVPSTSIAEVDNTEEVVEARLHSVQDDMDLVTNNEPRLNENMTIIECELNDIKVEPESSSQTDENIQPAILDTNTLSSVFESQARTEVAAAVAKTTFRRTLNNKVASSQPSANDLLQSSEASSSQLRSLLTVKSPSTINSDTVRLNSKLSSQKDNSPGKTQQTASSPINERNQLETDPEESPCKSFSQNKDRQGELPPGWTRKLHIYPNRSKRYYTYHPPDPIEKTFYKLWSAWEYHQAMMNESIDADAQNVEAETVIEEKNDHLINTNNDNRKETEVCASAMPVDDNSSQAVVIKREKSVTVEENENINQELNTQSSSSPVLKKKKNKEKCSSPENPPTQYFENKIKSILMEVNVLHKTGKEGPRKRMTSEIRLKLGQGRRTVSESSVEILNLNQDKGRKEVDLVLLDDSSSDEYKGAAGGDGNGPVIASVDELLLDSDSEFLQVKTQSKKKSLPKVIQGKDVKNMLKKKKKKENKIILV